MPALAQEIEDEAGIRMEAAGIKPEGRNAPQEGGERKVSAEASPEAHGAFP